MQFCVNTSSGVPEDQVSEVSESSPKNARKKYALVITTTLQSANQA